MEQCDAEYVGGIRTPKKPLQHLQNSYIEDLLNLVHFLILIKLTIEQVYVYGHAFKKQT